MLAGTIDPELTLRRNVVSAEFPTESVAAIVL
jgi:hypothetical protein